MLGPRPLAASEPLRYHRINCYDGEGDGTALSKPRPIDAPAWRRVEPVDPLKNAAPFPLDRAALYAILDDYLDALKVRDHARPRWAARVRNTENNVALMIGDGLWGTITALGSYDLRFADTKTGQVGYFGTAIETVEESGFTIRLKVERDGTISEVETLVVRQSDSGIKFEGQRYDHKPILNTIVPPEERSARARMLDLSNGYFATLQLNDGTILTKFAPDCQRVENGVQTTNNPNFPIVPVCALGCEEQFRMGNYRYDDRLRGRRFPLVDEERGLVLAAGFIDHAGTLTEYRLTDGRLVKSPINRPHSFYLFELFKIRGGQIEQIEANFITVPYNMPSPWDAWGE